jgi:hypothetical protein
MINAIEYGAKAMAAAEGDKSKEMTSEEIALLHSEYPGFIAVSRGWRRAGQPSMYDLVKDGCKLAGARHNAHATLWHGQEAQVLGNDVEVPTGQGLTVGDAYRMLNSLRNARGDQAIAVNAGPTLVAILTPGAGGLVHLCNVLTEKAGNENQLLSCIKNAAENMLVMAQLAITFCLFALIFGPYRASRQLNQQQLITISKEIFEVLQLHHEPTTLWDLLFPNCGPDTVSGHRPLVKFLEKFSLKYNTQQLKLIRFCADPPPLSDSARAAFHAAVKIFLPAYAGGAMNKFAKLCGPQYGNLLMLNEFASTPVETDTLTLMKAEDVPSQTTAVEGVFGEEDMIKRQQPSLSHLRVHCLLMLRNVDVHNLLYGPDTQFTPMKLTKFGRRRCTSRGKCCRRNGASEQPTTKSS